MRRTPFPYRLLAGLLGLTAPAMSVSITPIAHVSALGGQYFTGQTHSNGFNIDASVVPVIALSSRLYLIPIYTGSYHETQSVYNFLGENTLIQKQFDQTGVLRLAWAASSSWRLKPRAGFTKEWIQQSTDEDLWGGLFNYTRGFGGISAERVMGNGSIELGYEFGNVEYPKYHALIADSRLTSTGITSSAGSKVLDFHAHETTLQHQITADDKRWALNSRFSWMREGFLDQKVMTQNPSGFVQDFSDSQRVDTIYTLALQQAFKPSERWTVIAGETFQYYTSNQNAFDANQVQFTAGYYNFIDTQLNPSITFTADEALWDATLGVSYGYRRYSHRQKQNTVGTYENSLVTSMNRGTHVTLRYDLGKKTGWRSLKGVHAVITGSVLTYWSNTRYEENYPYNYTVYNYLGGLSWDF